MAPLLPFFSIHSQVSSLWVRINNIKNHEKEAMKFQPAA